jgi:hypothetical protein
VVSLSTLNHLYYVMAVDCFQPDQWHAISLQHSAEFVSLFFSHISSFTCFQTIDIILI